MGELGHVNTAVRAREQGVDCAYWWEQGTGNQGYIPKTVTFCCYLEKNIEPVSVYPSGKKNGFFYVSLN